MINIEWKNYGRAYATLRPIALFRLHGGPEYYTIIVGSKMYKRQATPPHAFSTLFRL
jgi:hypothetical protein